MSEWVSIRVRKQTRERLKALGRKGESYDDVIQHLIKVAEGRNCGHAEAESSGVPKG